MRIRACSWLIAFLSLSLPISASQAAAPDAFLDQPVPPSLIPHPADPHLDENSRLFLAHRLPLSVSAHQREPSRRARCVSRSTRPALLDSAPGRSASR